MKEKDKLFDVKNSLSLFSPSFSFFTFAESSPVVVEFFYDVLVDILRCIADKHPYYIPPFPVLSTTKESLSSSMNTEQLSPSVLPKVLIFDERTHSPHHSFGHVENSYFACTQEPPTPFQLLVETTRIIQSYSCPECSTTGITSLLAPMDDCDNNVCFMKRNVILGFYYR
jgi:hypothetical protein